MSDFARKISELSPQKLALLCVELQAALEKQRKQASEPIAVIGLGCRMPGGGNDPASFWKLLREGVDCTREVPWNRWNPLNFYDPDSKAPGRMYTSRGGFLDVVDRFDSAAFRMSPREAAALDPQQRLLLEVSWEAIEDAGLLPEKLVRSRTGVFIGIGVDDYARRQLKAGVEIDAYSGTGNAFCFAAGRLSYFFGLQGPSLALDTACSSSLVTVHLACQSLRSRECDQALAGGVNLILSPEASIFLSRSGALSPDGRCKTFDEGADGYGRSEGVGILVLRRLNDALASGDRILALIRGSAVNHDGPSGGLTVPNSQAQKAVIRQALQNAGVEPSEIGYVEAHGTGTPLGDPIEIRALTEIFEGRTDPLWIGSVKTNIGHLETSAGVASLIKVILALQNEELPPHLHFRSSNPHLSLSAVPARLAVSRTPWPRGGSPRLAGVSSFGLSGTNAHIVLEEAPAQQHSTARRDDAIYDDAIYDDTIYQLRLTARTPEALVSATLTWCEWLDSAEARAVAVRDICYTAAFRRTRYPHEAVATGKTCRELSRMLRARLNGDPALPAEGAVTPREGRVVSLPAYPFARQHCWFEEEIVRDFVLSRSDPAWLGDHRIYNTVLFPATGYLALAASAGAPVVRDLSIEQPLTIPESGTVTLRLVVKPDGTFCFLCAGGTCATGHIEFAGNRDPRPTAPGPVFSSDGEWKDGPEYYELLRSCGFHYGPAFRCIQELRRADGELWSRIELPGSLAADGTNWPLHPALLDACMQSLGLEFDYLASALEAWLPIGVGTFRIHRPHTNGVWCRVVPGSRPENASLELFDGDGCMVAEIAGLQLRRTQRQVLLAMAERTLPAGVTEDWFYKLSWTPSPRLSTAEHRSIGGNWLIVGGPEPLSRPLASRMEARGATVRRAAADEDVEGSGRLSGVVHLTALDSRDPAIACGSLLRLTQGLARTSTGPKTATPFWIVTSGAHEANPLQAPLWGVGRTLALEHPELWGGLIDLDPALPPSEQASLLASEIAAPDAERQITYRDGIRLGARIVRTSLSPASLSPASTAIDPEGTYLITGGTGALGRRVAEAFTSWGARHVVIASRNAPVPVDISQEREVVELLNRIARDLPPLKGIVHASGVLDDGILAEQNQDRFERVFAPKLRGALFLDRHTRQMDLDFFVMFSAFSTLTGSPGQSGYVAANSFLDALAANRRAHGLKALSIGWGPFAEAGMSARMPPKYAAQRAALGITDIPLNRSTDLLRCLLSSRNPHVAVMPVDWERFVQAYSGPPTKLFSEVTLVANAAGAESNLRELIEEEPDKRREKLSEFLRVEIARQLRYSPGELPALPQSLAEIGFDSLLSLELRNRISHALKVEIPARMFFENETLGDLLEALDEQLSHGGKKAEAGGTNGHASLGTSSADKNPADKTLADETLAGIHSLSESELEALLVELSGSGRPA
jgi:acyl transferase domain-containing protein/acyl carrier protein